MIGIINADGTMTWVLTDRPGLNATVRIRPVRHGQKKIKLRFFWKESGGKPKEFAVMKFQTGTDGFLESPEFETTLRIDTHNRLYVSVDCMGVIHTRRLRLPFKHGQGSKGKDVGLDTTAPAPAPNRNTAASGFLRYWRHAALLLAGTAGFAGGLIILLASR